MKVPYLSPREIAEEAEALLCDFWMSRDLSPTAPVPVEEILEHHLRLSLGFDDLHARFDVPQNGKDPDVLGALFVGTGEVLVNQVLDPEVFPFAEGRYRFTLGHEIGHWQLHRELVTAGAGQLSLFDQPAEPPIICRQSQAREPIEWQADTYAAHLLMPQLFVVEAWRSQFGDIRTRVVRSDHALSELLRPLATEFRVSVSAMRIRCEHLRLLHRDIPSQRLLTAAS